MSYRCEIGPGLGIEPGPPRIKCDGCGLTLEIKADRRPPAWFLFGGAAPGWKRTRDAVGKRDDRCPRCKPHKGTAVPR